VLFGGRRWWYQSQAILSERSRLIDSPGVWFLCGLLRSHGYDHTTLRSMVGKPVTSTSWRVGDVVAPKKTPASEAKEGEVNAMENDMSSGSLIGHIVPETPGGASPSALSSQSRSSGTVVVEFTSRAFADAVGLKSTGVSSDSKFTIETRRVRTSKLVHAGVVCRRSVELQRTGENKTDDAMETEDSKPSAATEVLSSESEEVAASVSEKSQSDIAALSILESSAIDALAKECRKSPEALASLFSAGLPDAILSAIRSAERQMNTLEPRDDLSEKLAGIGALVNSIADQLFGDPVSVQSRDELAAEPAVAPRPERSSPNPVRISQASSRSGRGSLAREVLARREARRAQNQDDSQNLAASLQQRRNMLLSLMSRAGRRSNAGAFLNDMVDALDAPRDYSLDQLPPSMASVRGMHPFVFGAPSAMFGGGDGEGGWDDPQMMELAMEGADSHQQESSASRSDNDNTDSAEIINENASYLDSILRCRRGVSAAQLSGSLKQGGAAHSVFVRSLINKGILVDSVDWANALVDAHSRKVQLSSLASNSNLLRDAVDEEGTPLLRLAVALGCSADVVARLIALGALVGIPEIKNAAQTNQPKTLALLLKHTSYKEGVIDLDQCSPEVAQVLAQTKSRQSLLDKKMRDAAGSFMVKLVRRLFKVGLSSRRSDSTRIDLCSKVICEMLVGNVLLGALQRAQQVARVPVPPDAANDPNRDVNLGGRCLENTASGLKLAPQGLLLTLPRSILGDCLFSDKGHVTTFLLVVEEYLSSKEMDDIAAGLSFLLILLKNFPQLRACAEIERFGVSEFVSSHNVLASDRIADILSKQFTVGLDVSASPGGAAEEQLETAGAGTVVCPKKHTAVLHITRHSSFRCDVCGSGVDRGRPMHGCRECDWDLCENCNPTGLLVKCSAVRELTSECQRLISDDASTAEEAVEDDDIDYAKILEELSRVDAASSKELNELSMRLLQRDILAVKDLGDMLNDPGRITFHQFLSVILPAIHASLVGRPNGAEGIVHRNKKAKVLDASDSSASETLDARLEFCREALRHMVEDSKASFDSATALAAAKGAEENEKEENPESGRVDITYCAGASEILRRLHQVLSFYEAVQVFSSSSEKDTAGSSSPRKTGDLQTLTKPIELQLLPSGFDESESVSPKSRSVIHAELLIPFLDLQLHVSSFRLMIYSQVHNSISSRSLFPFGNS